MIAAVIRTWTIRALLVLADVAIDAADAVARMGARHRRIVMHRLLRCDPDGGTWCVRGAQVPASRTTDVYLEIDPAADSHYCPDCMLGAVRLLDAGDGLPRVVECRDCGSQFGLACVSRRE